MSFWIIWIFYSVQAFNHVEVIDKLFLTNNRISSTFVIKKFVFVARRASCEDVDDSRRSASKVISIILRLFDTSDLSYWSNASIVRDIVDKLFLALSYFTFCSLKWKHVYFGYLARTARFENIDVSRRFASEIDIYNIPPIWVCKDDLFWLLIEAKLPPLGIACCVQSPSSSVLSLESVIETRAKRWSSFRISDAREIIFISVSPQIDHFTSQNSQKFFVPNCSSIKSRVNINIPSSTTLDESNDRQTI